jgi:hypothetical protein
MYLQIGYNAEIPMNSNFVSPNLLYFIMDEGELVTPD